MPERSPEHDGGRGIDVRDYVDATRDAATRTRAVMIALMTTCVLVFSGLLNSLQSSWAHGRIEALSNEFGEYAIIKIGKVPTAADSPQELRRQWGRETVAEALLVRHDHYTALYSEMMHAYVDSAFLVKVPFFGVTVDVNDLGLLGGIGITLVLAMCTLCLAREVENLDAAFCEAGGLGKKKELYTLLAMRQVFTIPRASIGSTEQGSLARRRNGLAVLMPRAMYIVPPLVHGAVTLHDAVTAFIGNEVGKVHTQVVLFAEVFLWGIIIVLSYQAARRQAELDALWDTHR